MSTSHAQHTFADKGALTDALGEFIVKCSQAAITQHGRFTIAFSGGSAATSVCACLNLNKFRDEVDWSKWFIFFCDERFVELTNSDSNYKAIEDGLLSQNPHINRQQVFKLKYTGTVHEAAQEYEDQLKTVFEPDQTPQFDLLVLGMGPDGHICSLFPHHILLKEEKKWVCALSDSPKPPPERITLSLNVVNNARNVLFYTTGKGKAENIRSAIEGESSEEVPASLVRPKSGSVHWFMDTDAASLLAQK